MTEIKTSGGNSADSLLHTMTAQNFLTVSTHLELTAKSSTKTDKHTHSIIGNLNVDKYYSSLGEDTSVLMDDAKELLTTDQYITFFQTCGPAYIRSIRRNISLITIFNYENESTTSDSSLYSRLKSYGLVTPGPDIENSKKSQKNVNESSLRITMIARGIGRAADSTSMIPTKMEDYPDTMKAVYKNSQEPNTGAVAGVEIVYYVNSANFGVVANFQTHMDFATCTDEEDGSGNEVTCGTAAEASREAVEVNPMVRKFNTIENAEHVVRVEESVRDKLATIDLMTQCLSRLFEFPLDSANSALRNNKCLDFGQTCPEKTVQGLLTDLLGEDGEGEYYIQRELTRVRGFIAGYYSPCIYELSGEAYNLNEGNFQLTHWMNIPECNHMACTFSSAHWNGATCESAYNVESLQADINKKLLADMFCMPELQ
eukprot:CAMPEP_0113314144 /NCGR_PEP_ID=MMETSP0010_2-20120614/10314_1 /TAXON_ID=216773 ORGANISM="Corethron hystrix, Strain 308" /NCGR_SAMPLE_ID=MMETSP0010_2 /ASSEMBLY_ACC=CAM_ASM_000155 /LENGTH=427 /DNA_ID=CAMNT_0000170355 /DNA_START=295 /DNA_END=1581 /DNA_ORIENTATION=+ /assembly_acc=CAM_ASM_000155